MSIHRPANRSEFKQYCLRALGKPVLDINADDDQIEDAIDYCLQYYWDYHFDGSEKCYYKYVIQDKDTPGHVSDIDIANGGIGYQNTDTVVITANSASNTGHDAVATITTNEDGTIVSTNISNSGTAYLNPPSVTVESNTGTGAVLVGFNGGYIRVPDNVIGAVRIFPIGGALQSQNMFNIRYQIALNDLYTLTSVSMLPYFLALQQIQFIEYMLVGQQPIRFNRHKNKVYLDMNWERDAPDLVLIVECYQIIDPDIYTDAWNDRWLKRYGIAQIKKYLATNLKKFPGVEMPGRVTFSGQQMYNEAIAEIEKLEAEMINSYSLPVTDMIG